MLLLKHGRMFFMFVRLAGLSDELEEEEGERVSIEELEFDGSEVSTKVILLTLVVCFCSCCVLILLE